jgi:hypothetical protein
MEEMWWKEGMAGVEKEKKRGHRVWQCRAFGVTGGEGPVQRNSEASNHGSKCKMTSACACLLQKPTVTRCPGRKTGQSYDGSQVFLDLREIKKKPPHPQFIIVT